MNYTPHTLQVKVENQPARDEFGNPIFSDEPFTWKTIGECRCDDNGQMKQISVNGTMFDFSYHVVYEGKIITPGTEIRVFDEVGRTRGFGKVSKSAKCNFLPYSELWV